MSFVVVPQFYLVHTLRLVTMLTTLDFPGYDISQAFFVLLTLAVSNIGYFVEYSSIGTCLIPF
jgi:hypothetical protein